ncbi:DUF58 domain-containing protein [Chondromyces crocatus]|uniref:DUF58 domain-containing protein n=1 Tax=Chondromyces crocatus TaxID=52 RepID=A0A0K1EEX6_CHOCO|nr:DUF58 domain-containing protein [Chondromyces crocatus]AKT39113.1 uncharacterized protein CMC5_032600 [Chondromyces crocatus]
MKINFAKLNHALIPTTKEGRDRFRRSLLGRAVVPFAALYNALTDEGRILALVSFLVGGLGLEVQSTEAHLVWCGLTALLFGSIFAQRHYRLDAFRVEVLSAPRVSVGEEILFTVMLRNQGPRDAHALRLVGPFLPWDGRWIGTAPRVPRVPAGGSARLEVRARFIERGEHHLDPFEVAALAPLGLSQGSPVASAGTRFLVVPRIARVQRLSLPLGQRHQPGGVSLASKTGESMDLLGVRPYRPGDPVRQLHARSSARTGTPIVREYQEEHFTRVGVLVDPADADPEQLEALLSLTAGVVAHLSRGEALIDLLVVGDQVHDMTLGRHLGFLEQALDLLACVPSTAATRPTAIDTLLARLSPHLANLSCLVLVTATQRGSALAASLHRTGVRCRTFLVVREPRRTPQQSPRPARHTAAHAAGNPDESEISLRAVNEEALFL